jgi:hypothetical protein
LVSRPRRHRYRVSVMASRGVRDERLKDILSVVFRVNFKGLSCRSSINRGDLADFCVEIRG